MRLSEYHIIIKQQVQEYLDQTLSSLLKEGAADKQYKSVLHYLGTHREDAWKVISPLRSFFDKKIYDIAQSIAEHASDIRTVIETLTTELNEKSVSNKKAIDNQFGKGTSQDLYEYLRGRRSDFIQNLSEIVAEREEIMLKEEDGFLDKNALSSVIVDQISYVKSISKEFEGVTPCGDILLEYAKMLDPNKWIEQISKDVIDYVFKNSDEERSDELEERFQTRVQDIVGEMILTTPVWLLLELTDELKYTATQIIIEIIFVSMISPEYLKKWDALFRRMGVGSITLRIGKVMKFINK